MSYEGYVQRLCENGHFSVVDAFSQEASACSACGKAFVWTNDVDETNGDSWGFIDVERFRTSSTETKTCDMGHVHFVEHPPVYRIPTNTETTASRSFQTSNGEWKLCNIDHERGKTGP